MSFGLPHPLRPFGARGLLFAVLALVSQLALGAMVLPDDAAARDAASLAAVSVLCDSSQVSPTGAVGGTHRQAPLPHRHHQGALCPLSLALALPAVVLAALAVLPAPTAATVLRLATGQRARAPPSLVGGLGLPRGPPIPA